MATRRGASAAGAAPAALLFRALRTRIIGPFWPLPSSLAAPFFKGAAAATGKRLIFAGPFHEGFFWAFHVSACEFDLLDKNRPPGAIGRFTALDAFAGTALFALLGAQRRNMLAGAWRRFDLRFNFGFGAAVWPTRS